MKERVITVFGGTGFVGLRVVRALLAEGATVRVACRDPRCNEFSEFDERLECVSADVRDRALAGKAVDGADGVVNVVSLYVETPDASFRDVHVLGARTLAECASDAGIGRFVHVSGLGASPASPSMYVRARFQGEQAVRSAFPEAVILRPSVIFGPEDAFLSRLSEITRLPVIPLFGRGRTRLQPVYVDDVAQAVVRVLSRPDVQGSTFELGGAEVYTYRDVVEMVLEKLHRRRLLLPLPFAAWHAMVSAANLAGQPPLTHDQVFLMERDSAVGKDAKGFADLGIEPESLHSLLSECLP